MKLEIITANFVSDIYAALSQQRIIASSTSTINVAV